MHNTDRLDKVRDLALKAADRLLEAWKKPRNVAFKGRIDLVTDSDIAIENFLRGGLAEILPEADFLAEESSPGAGLGEKTWVIDPIDGTTNFVHSLPLVGISIALVERGAPTLAVIALPLLGECYTALRGGGAYCNGLPLKVSTVDTMEKALIGTGFSFKDMEQLEPELAVLRGMLSSCQGVRMLGASVVKLAFVAAGRLDGYYERGPKTWDVAAGILLVEEAGGVISDFEGNKHTLQINEIVAGNRLVHSALIADLGAGKIKRS